MAFTDLPKVSDAEKTSEEMRLKLQVEIFKTIQLVERENNYDFSITEKEIVFLEIMHKVVSFRLSFQLDQQNSKIIKP